MARFEKRRADFEKKGTKLCAISVDPVKDSKVVAEKKNLGFPILSDSSGATMRAWGVWHEKERIALPAIFVVGRDGKVAWRRVSESVDDRPSEDEVLEAAGKAP